MKIKQLTTSVALASLVGSGLAVAGDHGNSLKFGGFFQMSKTWEDSEFQDWDFDGAGNQLASISISENETTRKELNQFSLWFSADLDENFDIYAELNGDDRESDISIEQAWVHTDMFGQWAHITAGQQRLNFDGDHTRRTFNDIALNDASIASMTLGSIGLYDNVLGVTLSGTDGHFSYALGIYDDPFNKQDEFTEVDNGVAFPNDSVRFDSESDISHIFTLRAAYLLGEQDDTWKFQGAISYFDAEGDEEEETFRNEATQFNEVEKFETSSDGFNVELAGTWSAPNMAFELGYLDAEFEDNFSDNETFPTGFDLFTDMEEWELSGFYLLVAIASGGQYNMAPGGLPVLDLPAADGIVWEGYVRWYDYEVDLDEREFGGNEVGTFFNDAYTHENDIDGFAIGGTAYINQHVSVGIEYGMGDVEFVSTEDDLEDTVGPVRDDREEEETDFITAQLQVRF